MSPAVQRPGGRGRRVVVLRHGVTEHNARGIWQGHLDSHLTPEGIAQAESVVAAIASYRPDVVATSDLRRAQDTARIVMRGIPGRDLIKDPRLKEIDVGQWQGLERELMAQRFPDASALLTGREDFRRGEDGETYGEVGDRTGAAVADLLAGVGDGGTLLLVTHGVAARVITGDLLGLDRPTSWALFSGLGNCRWAEIREYADRWHLVGWNIPARFGAEATGS